jgi:hypothetical protein
VPRLRVVMTRQAPPSTVAAVFLDVELTALTVVDRANRRVRVTNPTGLLHSRTVPGGARSERCRSA